MAKKYLQLGNILKRLLFDKGMKPVDLARKVNIPPPTIHRLITGKSTRPYRSSLKPIADYFSVSVDQLLGEQPLTLDFSTKNNLNTVKNLSHLPLIPWEQICIPNAESKHETIPFVGNISEEGYATILPDFSMEPLFSRGSMLIFDPKKPHKDRSFVLVKICEAKLPVFRQLLIDLDQQYLKPLNPDLNAFKMRIIRDGDKIIATLIEARQIYDEQ